MVSKPLYMTQLLLIIGISSGSYSKITYNFNSHTIIIDIQVYTITNHIQARIHKFTNTINIYI
jgi:hypothetical protein